LEIGVPTIARKLARAYPIDITYGVVEFGDIAKRLLALDLLHGGTAA
jgi:hypothetical protein